MTDVDTTRPTPDALTAPEPQPPHPMPADEEIDAMCDLFMVSLDMPDEVIRRIAKAA